MSIGIYTITNVENKKVYIGQSTNLEARENRHFWFLKQNRHPNDHLQKAFNKYGQDNFVFEIIEETTDTDLDKKEMYYISLLKSNNRKYGYNKESGGSLGKRHCEETRKMMSERQKKFANLPEQKKRVSEWAKNRKRSEKERKLHRERVQGERSSLAKLSEENVREIKTALFLGIAPKELSNIFNVTFQTIYDIRNMKTWSHVLPRLNASLLKNPLLQERDAEILSLYKSGLSFRAIGRELKISHSTVSKIIKQTKEVAM
ncbi:GIY-YIG nuclease family protein [Bacillus cereus]|nr:GIY-YIG nuclease family protein [Bacillus cereus]MEC3260577.1 GIY-YIG nuclease family protein [Bacillus cereus]